MSLFASRRNQIFALIAVLLGFAVVYMNFVAPAREDRFAREQQLAQKKKELAQLEKKLDGSGGLKAKELVELAKVRSRIPEAPYLESLLRDVRMLEVVSRVSMAHYNFEVGKEPGPKTADGKEQSQGNGGSAATAGNEPQAANGTGAPAVSPLAVPIKLNTTVKGDYAHLRRLLEEIQTMGRLYSVDQITFSAQASPPVKLNASRDLTCNLTLVSYYAPGLQRFFKTPIPIDHTATGERSNSL